MPYEINHHLSPPPSSNQLSLNDIMFIRESVQKKASIVLTSGVVLHMNDFIVGKNDFCIKLSYRSQSFKVHGRYVLENVSPRTADDSSHVCIKDVQMVDILCYRAGVYKRESSPQVIQKAIGSVISEFLSDPQYNAFLATSLSEERVYH